MAASGAPKRAALDYFPKVVNFYEDDKIFDLLDEYGPLGVTIYDCILTIVYSNGYFANLSKDKLSRMVIRKIGNKWIKSQKVVVQVIDYCADLGLLCNDLMLQNIITSVGIQKRYYKIAVKLMKRQLYSTEYWLLDKNGEPLLNAPSKQINSELNPFSSEEITNNSEEIRQKEKETKRKENKISRESQHVPEPVLNAALVGYMEFRERVEKPMTERGIRLLLDELEKLSSNPQEQAAILDQSTKNGWIGVYELSAKSKTSGKTAVGKGNKFCNFEQRDTDYDAMVAAETRKMIEESGEGE